MKKCTKCKLIKSLDNFHRYKRSSDGYKTQCKKCRNLTNKQYRNKNPEYSRIWRDAHKDSIKEYDAKYRTDNRNKIAEAKKIYVKKNKEAVTAQKSRWYQKNKDKVIAGKIRRRDRKAKVKEGYTTKDYRTTMAAFENCCYNCNSIKDLCIDHHKPLIKGNALKLDNAVVLCRTCNLSKGTKNPEDFYSKEVCAELNKKLHNIQYKEI